ncbi:MAG: hypothetical protein ACTSXL_02510 [Alphaproteobacteria bacterium]
MLEKHEKMIAWFNHHDEFIKYKKNCLKSQSEESFNDYLITMVRKKYDHHGVEFVLLEFSKKYLVYNYNQEKHDTTEKMEQILHLMRILSCNGYKRKTKRGVYLINDLVITFTLKTYNAFLEQLKNESIK